MINSIREPAVAGSFYPAQSEALRQMVRGFLVEARAKGPRPVLPPKAIIAPHAGYIYSGPVAASAYAALGEGAGIGRVVLLGPSHRVGFRGLATTGAEAYRTPLGDIPVDRRAVACLERLPEVILLDQAHLLEHSLEVHLPFLQELLGTFDLVPLVVGETGPAPVAAALQRVWGGPETLIVVSSDLSHYHDYATARVMDAATSEAIETLHPERLDEDSACGRNPIRGLLLAARRKGLRGVTLDVRNSGDTAGPRDRVVGYGAYAFVEALDA